MNQTGNEAGNGGWGALAGLKVLDFTQALAGPYGSQVLADMGAEVLKVEETGTGDKTRAAGPFRPEDPEHRHGGYFHSVNRNKRSMALNLKDPASREIVFALIEDHDVVLENFRAGTMEKFGLSYEELSARNPRLIYGALRGFGDPRTGESPYGAWSSLDVVAQAMGGINGVTGARPGEPTKVGPGIGDIVPGMFLALGVLGALYSRERTGKGQFLDVAMVDSILAITERIVYQRSFGGVIAGISGNHHPWGVPFGIFPAADGHVSIAGSNDRVYRDMCAALEAPHLAEDERFVSAEARRAHREEFIAALSRVTEAMSKAELMRRLGGVLPFGPVYTMEDIANDPHFAIRDMLVELAIPGMPAGLTVAGTPIKMAGTPGGVRSPGPDLGGDTDRVLRAIGRSDAEIAELRERGAVR